MQWSSLLTLCFFQKHHAIENNQSFAQGLEVGQQKLVSTLAVAQSQIVELRSAALEKDRAIEQLRREMQQSVRCSNDDARATLIYGFFLGHGKTNSRTFRNEFNNEHAIQLPGKVLAPRAECF